jgi:hypothetical protein
MVAEAKLWQARSYAELGWMYESEDILNKLNINGIPKSKQRRYASVYADYLIKSKQSKEAIPYLITAIKAEKNRKQRTRMKYLLGQLYAGEGLDGLAYKVFWPGYQCKSPIRNGICSAYPSDRSFSRRKCN